MSHKRHTKVGAFIEFPIAIQSSISHLLHNTRCSGGDLSCPRMLSHHTRIFSALSSWKRISGHLPIDDAQYNARSRRPWRAISAGNAVVFRILLLINTQVLPLIVFLSTLPSQRSYHAKYGTSCPSTLRTSIEQNTRAFSGGPEKTKGAGSCREKKHSK